ncbi:MAG: hypothetical protein JSU70_21350 [Phycisphaerales bacterium]|nr:MAG: hypothetical protein JSU70_21350 [Phycisphaerales bacterium]
METAALLRSVILATLVVAGQLSYPSPPRARGAETMTFEQAVRRIPSRTLPEFWVGDVTGLAARFEKLTRCDVTTIARSPGGRPIHLIAYGARENLKSSANYNSAVGARERSAYLDKAARQRPVILFVGPVHGHEVEALTGLVNLAHILQTGKDLRGRNQPKIHELASRCRLLIIPEGNPDGIARLKPRALHGMEDADVRFWGQGTWGDDTFCGWPGAKRQHPMAGDNVGFLGCYFNEKGINPMHDEFFDPMGPEAPAILKVAREEAPDLTVSLHSHESRPAILRPAYVPLEIQKDVRSLAERCYALLAERGLPHGGLFEAVPEAGKFPAPFNLTSAMYHISGANSFTFECPHGINGRCQVSLEEILDIQLTLYEAMMRHEISKKGP